MSERDTSRVKWTEIWHHMSRSQRRVKQPKFGKKLKIQYLMKKLKISDLQFGSRIVILKTRRDRDKSTKIWDHILLEI